MVAFCLGLHPMSTQNWNGLGMAMRPTLSLAPGTKHPLGAGKHGPVEARDFYLTIVSPDLGWACKGERA